MATMTNTTTTTTSGSVALFVTTTVGFVWWKLQQQRQTRKNYRGLEALACPTMDIDTALQLLYPQQQQQPKLTKLNGDTTGNNSTDHNHQKKRNVVLIDTRTPDEYQQAHIWGAINIPLMSNAQRQLIGTTYHKQSRAAAIFLGWTLFTPHVSSFLQHFTSYLTASDDILIYCWRGGMRSRIVVNLLLRQTQSAKNLSNVYQITGGYKHYLNHVVWKGLERMAQQYTPKFIVLFGHTGTRKTEILRTLRDVHGLPVIDLEGLAGHRSSVYGAVDLQPASQKMFSIGIYHTLLEYQHEPYIFMEGEANKVGDVHVPQFLCDQIATTDHKILVQATLDTRITAICQEYVQTTDSVRQLHDATETVRKYVGHKNADHLHSLLDVGDFRTCTEWLLVNHYDPSYRFDKKGHVYDMTVHSDDLDQCCTQLVNFYQQRVQEHHQQQKREQEQPEQPA